MLAEPHRTPSAFQEWARASGTAVLGREVGVEAEVRGCNVCIPAQQDGAEEPAGVTPLHFFCRR